MGTTTSTNNLLNDADFRRAIAAAATDIWLRGGRPTPCDVKREMDKADALTRANWPAYSAVSLRDELLAECERVGGSLMVTSESPYRFEPTKNALGEQINRLRRALRDAN